MRCSHCGAIVSSMTAPKQHTKNCPIFTDSVVLVKIIKGEKIYQKERVTR